MMVMIAPMEVTPAHMLGSNVPETDAPLWTASGTVSAGQRRVHQTAVWEAVTTNSGSEPREGSKDWARFGATNRWRAFDQQLQNSSAQAERLSWRVAVTRPVDTVALMKPQGATARVTMRDGAGRIVARQERTIAGTQEIKTLHDFFFGEREVQAEIVFDGLPVTRVGEIEVEIFSPGRTASVAQVVIGRREVLGRAGTGLEIGFEDYSRIETDAFGNRRIVRRAAARLADYRIGIARGNEERVLRLLERQRARPALYAALDPDGRAVGGLIYGLAKPIRITAGVGLSTATLSIEGLV